MRGPNGYLLALMEIEIHKLGQPTAYRDDFFVHDKAVVQGMEPGDTGYWLIRENGTHLFLNREDESPSARSHICHLLKSSSEVVALYQIKNQTGVFPPEVNRIPYGWMFK